ncbi:MAG TPA: hypothetical protein VFD49_24425 [Candidatus Dormibacteraeota bacterium]|nr:hypothetical protein [Candidatus Dormibacteraeota bacterium]
MANRGQPAPGGIERPSAPVQRRDWRQIARLIGVAILVLLLIAFIVVNSREVRIDFISFTVNVALIWALLGTLLAGIAADRLLTWRGGIPHEGGGPRRRGDRPARPAPG